MSTEVTLPHNMAMMLLGACKAPPNPVRKKRKLIKIIKEVASYDGGVDWSEEACNKEVTVRIPKYLQKDWINTLRNFRWIYTELLDGDFSKSFSKDEMMCSAAIEGASRSREDLERAMKQVEENYERMMTKPKEYFLLSMALEAQFQTSN